MRLGYDDTTDPTKVTSVPVVSTVVAVLLVPIPDWQCTVDLAFTEIRICGGGQPQVSRRLAAALDDLLRITPEARRPPLLAQRDLLERAVAEHVPAPGNRAFALAPDRQGIG
ncbi:hypothetical protein KCMC57_up56400 [Kitasatospora sp. CMC57]|uniref:Uncharacterized protein n=1 Tax=Kitasatospora sp. CMC57 TaxID=3231513 RepID=A0AB33K6G2_9ACTN